MNKEEPINKLRELLAFPKETEWIEFKQNNCYPLSEIGEYISALSNSACLHNKHDI